MAYQRFTQEELKERIRARDRRRGSDPKRKAAQIVYQKTPSGAAAAARAKAAYILRNKHKRFAQNVLNAAVRDGKIKRGLYCGRCNLPGELEAHHPDYSKPLEVIWVHDLCHKAIHKEEREARRTT